MDGDSWELDILPALEGGMAAVWLNRYRLACLDPGSLSRFTGSSRSRKSRRSPGFAQA